MDSITDSINSIITQGRLPKFDNTLIFQNWNIWKIRKIQKPKISEFHYCYNNNIFPYFFPQKLINASMMMMMMMMLLLLHDDELQLTPSLSRSLSRLPPASPPPLSPYPRE